MVAVVVRLHGAHADDRPVEELDALLVEAAGRGELFVLDPEDRPELMGRQVEHRGVHGGDRSAGEPAGPWVYRPRRPPAPSGFVTGRR